MTKEEFGFDLQPLIVLLKEDATLEFVLEQLYNVYFRFTELAFRASNSESEPIYENAIIARYWLERMITLFEEMRLKE